MEEQKLQEYYDTAARLRIEIDDLRERAREHLFDPVVLREVQLQLTVRLGKMQDLNERLKELDASQATSWFPARYLPATLDERG